jgi:Uma2 family endonuclease
MATITTPQSAPFTPTTPPPADEGPRPWKWTREQYYKLGELGFFEGKRVELIHGEIVELSPINWPHTVAVTKLADALRAAFTGIGTVMTQTPHPIGDSEPEPDVRVIAGRMQDYTDHPRTALLVVEVSDATLSYDTNGKAELYAESGATDYWVVDVKNRKLIVFRDPVSQPAGLGANAFRTRLVFDAMDSISPLAAPNSAIRVADLLP